MYTNLNNPVNYQLQDFGQFGFRVLDSTSMVVDGETYRTLYVVEDAVVSATTSKGDDLVSKPLLAGTLLHGLFSAPAVASGKVLAYMAGRLTAEEILELYTAYLAAIAGTTLENTDCLYDDLNQMGADTYADASLVLIPSGYSTGVVYGQRPLDSDSQITFTRASNATRVINGGLIEKVRTNLILQSNTFSDVAWTKVNATLTSGQIGTDGTTSAWLLQSTSTTCRITQVNSLTGLQTNSIIAKAGTSDFVLVDYTGAQSYYAWFNLFIGEVGTTGGTNFVSASIEPLGNGWYRCSVVGNITTAGTSTYRVADSNTSTVVTASSNIYIQNAQLEAGDIATDYIATGASSVSVGPVSNVPRIDYTGGGCGKLLLEPQRTNLALYSEQFNNAYWGAISSSITANSAISPDGYQNADNMPTTSGLGNGLIRIFNISSSTQYVWSIYAKSNGATSFKMRIFDGSTGASTTETKTPTSEWQRFDITRTSGASTSQIRIDLYDNDGDLLIYGAQFEAGAYATSYIPTLASSVTRVAEQYDKVITSLVPDATTFTWEVDFIVPEFSAGGGEFTGRNAAGTTQLRLYANNNGVVRFRVESGGQNYDTSVSVGDTAKCIFRCSSGVVSAFYNGVKIHTFTGVTMDFGKIQFGTPITSPKIIRSLVFPTALTDAQAIALTTL